MGGVGVGLLVADWLSVAVIRLWDGKWIVHGGSSGAESRVFIIRMSVRVSSIFLNSSVSFLGG